MSERFIKKEKNKHMKHLLQKWSAVALSAFLSVSGAHALMTFVKEGKAVSRIIVADKDTINRKAADLLQDFVQRISGARLPIVENAQAKKGDIVIGQGNTEGLTEDGFRLATQEGILRISSGGDKGAIYGVVTLLDDYLGVEYYTAHTYTLEKKPTIEIPELDRAENPSFRYRQTQSYAIQEDPIYKMWFRLEEPNEVFCLQPSSESLIRNTIPTLMENDAPDPPANGA